MSARYEAEGPEAEFEPGSRGRVLRNRVGVTSVREMERQESEALLAATQETIDETRVDQRFTADDIRRMHRRWLGDIYVWEFERGPLREYTPCQFDAINAQAAALAVVHAELILIHPFREGNGRCARLLAMLMGLQAGLPTLDFGGVRGAKKSAYIAAVHAALGRDYEPMTDVFRGVILRTMKSVVKSSSH